jgi:hypothetical protein
MGSKGCRDNCNPFPSLSTWNVHREVLIRVAADPQLPVDVPAPAFDPTPTRDCASVTPPRAGEGDSRDAWKGKVMGGVGLEEVDAALTLAAPRRCPATSPP